MSRKTQLLKRAVMAIDSMLVKDANSSLEQAFPLGTLVTVKVFDGGKKKYQVVGYRPNRDALVLQSGGDSEIIHYSEVKRA